jgi:hypothetical protein
VFLAFDTELEVFALAKDPKDELLEHLHGIISDIARHSCAKQNEVVKIAGESGLDFGGEKKIRSLLKTGSGRFWTTTKGVHNSTIYHPVQFGSFADPIGDEKLPNIIQLPYQSVNSTEKPTTLYSHPNPINAESGSLASDINQTAKLTEIDDADFTEIPTFTEADFEGVMQ